jgi:class 3 adenylate cyclase
LERKLAAILCADVYGYSRLMGENEEATLRTLSSHRKTIDSLIEQTQRRFVNSAGDSVLAEFASVVNAVDCAVQIQTALRAENGNLPPERRMQFRIGVNLGDVMVEGAQIYGDGVNVAARLESLAEPGGICISNTVREHLGNKLALNYQDLGAQSVKNIAEPVRVFRVLLNGTPGMPRGPKRIPQQVCPTRRALAHGPRDRHRDYRSGAASVAQATANLSIDSATGEARATAVEHSVQCGATVHKFKRRSQPGILQQRHQRSADQYPFAHSRSLCYRA